VEILQYSEEHRAFRESLRRFIKEEVSPQGAAWEEAGIVPKSIWKRMGDLGFLCMSVPKEYGGMDADLLYSVILTEELARAPSPVCGLAAPLHSDIVVPYILSYASEELKQKYLPGCVSGDCITAVAMTEPDAGSDLASITTFAVEEGDHVVINGQKTFISNGLNCDLLVLATKDPSVENPYQALDLYVVEAETPGFEKGQRLIKMGWHSQDTAELYFNDCRVPKKNRLGEKGSGFLMLVEKLQQERLMCCIMAVAGAEVLLERTIQYARENMESGKPLSQSQSNQFRIVEMSTEVKLGRTFIDKLVVDHMEGRDIVVEASMGKYWTTEMAQRVADGCMEIFGSNGCLEEYAVARAWRDTRVMAIFAGTNEIMKGIAAKFMGL
jgi:acyl-CoA dehydrogenase